MYLKSTSTPVVHNYLHDWLGNACYCQQSVVFTTAVGKALCRKEKSLNDCTTTRGHYMKKDNKKTQPSGERAVIHLNTIDLWWLNTP